MNKEKIIQKILNEIPCRPIYISMFSKEEASAEVKILDVKKGLEKAFEEGRKNNGNNP